MALLLQGLAQPASEAAEAAEELPEGR